MGKENQKNPTEYSPLIQNSENSFKGMDQLELHQSFSHESEQHVTAAYKNFQKRLQIKYRKCEKVSDIEQLEKALNLKKSDIQEKYKLDWYCWGAWLCGLPSVGVSLFWYYYHEVFEVPANSFALVEVSSGVKRRTELFGPGYYFQDNGNNSTSTYVLGANPLDQIFSLFTKAPQISSLNQEKSQNPGLGFNKQEE